MGGFQRSRWASVRSRAVEDPRGLGDWAIILIGITVTAVDWRKVDMGSE